MGFDLERFKDKVNEEFICSICTGVLKDAVITPECEHVFCRACILDWLNVKQLCPIDNSALKPEDVRSVPRICKNFLGALLISCNYASSGCSLFVKLDDLEAHVKECAFNPTALVPCEKNCGMSVLKGALSDHNCVQELRKSLDALKMENQDIKEKFIKLTDGHARAIEDLVKSFGEHARSIEEHTKLENELKRELNQLKQSSELNKNQINSLKNELRLVKKNSQAQEKGGASELQLSGNWWKGLKAVILSKYDTLHPVKAGNPTIELQDNGLAEDFHKFAICGCNMRMKHSCGIEKLQEFAITYRYFTSFYAQTKVKMFKYCFILKQENTHVPDNLLPKCGFAFVTDP